MLNIIAVHLIIHSRDRICGCSFYIVPAMVNSTHSKQSNISIDHIKKNNTCLLSFGRLSGVEDLRPQEMP